MSDQPVLPYGTGEDANSGFVKGSDTSEERARSDDASGRTSHRQRMVLRLLDHRAERGATWGEVADALALHHGQASGALSNLHKMGRIVRLAEKRGRSHVYVLPSHVLGRTTQDQGRPGREALLNELAFLLDQLVFPCTLHSPPLPTCLMCRAEQALAVARA